MNIKPYDKHLATVREAATEQGKLTLQIKKESVGSHIGGQEGF
jgi:hypothetical protein